MGSACSQQQLGGVKSTSVTKNKQQAAASGTTAESSGERAANPVAAAAEVKLSTTAAGGGVSNSIDNTLNNMAKQDALRKGQQKDNETTPADFAQTTITSDEQQRIEVLLNSPMCLASCKPQVVKIIRETWALAMKRSDFAVAFYNDLLTKHRSATEAIFYGVDIVLQAGRLVKMIEGAINLLETPKSLVPVIIRLGSRHVAYGTTSQHFHLVTDSLTFLIHETVGPTKITPEVIGHWRTVLGFFQEIMESGYSTDAGKAVGKKHHSRIQRTLLKCWKSSVAGHNKQLKQAGGSAPLPAVESVYQLVATQGASAGTLVSPTSSAPQLGAQTPLIFGVPATLTEAMIANAMQQYIANGGNKPNSEQVINVSESPIAGGSKITTPSIPDAPNNFSSSTAAPSYKSKEEAMNHLLAPPISSSALDSFTKLPPHEFDQLIADAFELGISHIDQDMPFFESRAGAAGGLSERPPTVEASELLYHRLQMTGKILSTHLGASRGDPESLNDAFVKATLQFASPEWNNPFVRDQMARFWMKFCSYINLSTASS